VASEFDLLDQIVAGQLSTANRPLRLRLLSPETGVSTVLMPQRISGTEAICGGIDYQILCVAGDAGLPLKGFIGLAAELQLVTDRGELHCICGIVAEARAGQSDGGLATYQLHMRDALALLDMRTNSRVFLDKNEIEIVEIILKEWRERVPALAAGFEFEFAFELQQRNYPKRAFTMQSNETDAAFVRRLLKRRGIAWFFRAGTADSTTVPDDGLEYSPVHTLVMFEDAIMLKANAAGAVRYHRFGATEERDTITAWGAVRALRPGGVSGFSWDYGDPLAADFMLTRARGNADQGMRGNTFAASLDDYRVETPHVGDNNADHAVHGQARMDRHDYETKHFHGESNVRDLRVGEWNEVTGHAELDNHADEERMFVITSLRVCARNNLPKDIDARIDRLFASNRWQNDDDAVTAAGEEDGAADARYHNRFTCVRRGIRIVPAFDPRADVPHARMQSALVVGPAGEEVHCDQQGRVKVRFPGMRGADHAHAHGAGASGTDADSAWVRVASDWAGNGPGSMRQCGADWLPRVGTEVLVDFMDGDPDRPVIVKQLYNQAATPPALSRNGELPGNRFLSGLRSREIGANRGNQLRFDDTPAQISAQLASDHGASELNLGWCTEPRADGAGAPRGEGAELRSDEYIALRAAKGMLLSAYKSIDGANGGGGKLLARSEFAALMRECGELFGALGKYAAEHQALSLDPKAQDDLTAAFGRWENGSNTAPNGADGGAPVVGITAPAGIGFATAQAIVSYAATNIDTVAQQHLQLTAGQRFNLNAGKGISLFSHHDGMALIAHNGKLLLQSQHDDTEINAAKNFKVTSTDGKITGMAKSIELIAEDGSFIKIGDGGITFGSSTPLKFHAPEFDFNAPSTMAVELPTFSGGATSLKFVAKYYPQSADGIAAAAFPHEIVSSADGQHDGKNDDAGKSAVLKSEAMHQASVAFIDKPTTK
jgi:type VI secretion system secreted protein VgrG